jgi:hypothetical protein
LDWGGFYFAEKTSEAVWKCAAEEKDNITISDRGYGFVTRWMQLWDFIRQSGKRKSF